MTDAPAKRRRPGWKATALTVVVMLIAAELTVRLVEGSLPPPSGWVSGEYALKDSRIDHLGDHGGAGTVLVGSSVIDVSIDPALLPATAVGPRGAYNAGLIGATPWIVDEWTRLLVVPRLHPDVVVIGISSRDLNINGAGNALTEERFRASPGGKHLLGTEDTTDKVDWWLNEHSALLRYRQVLRRPLEALFGYDPPDRNVISVTNEGLETQMLSQRYQNTEHVLSFFRREPLLNFDVNGIERDSFASLIQYLQGQGIRVVVLDTPVTQDYIDAHPRGQADYDTYIRTIDTIVHSTGAKMLRPGIWPPELFADPLHLNRAGADRLTGELARLLETLG
jgi:hypothetical protein